MAKPDAGAGDEPAPKSRPEGDIADNVIDEAVAAYDRARKRGDPHTRALGMATTAVRGVAAHEIEAALCARDPAS